MRGAELLVLNANMTMEKEPDELGLAKLRDLLRSLVVPQSWRCVRPEEQSSFQEMRNAIRINSENALSAAV